MLSSSGNSAVKLNMATHHSPSSLSGPFTLDGSGGDIESCTVAPLEVRRTDCCPCISGWTGRLILFESEGVWCWLNGIAEVLVGLLLLSETDRLE